MRNRPLLYACLMVLTVIGAAVLCGGDRFIKELRPSALETETSQGDTVIVRGQAYKIEQKEEYQAVYLKNNSIQSIQDDQQDGKSSFQESKIITYIDPGIQINIGNIVQVRGEVSFFQHARNPGNFDQKRHYQIRDIHGLVWAQKVELADGKVWKVRAWLYEFRNQWKETLLDVMGKEDGAALSAMMLGEKSEMDQELKSLYQANGIGHILAISGLHLSFVGVGIYQILRRITGSYTAGGAVGIIFLTLYIIMIGLTVSALRAFIMFLFRVGADITGRHYDAPTALAVAAVAALAWRPLYLYDGGFWLSFGAVFGILAVQPVLQMSFTEGRSIWKSLGRVFGANISIHSVIFPVMLYYFFEFPLYSFILNLFIIPMMSVLLFLGMLGSIWYVSFLPGAGICMKICKAILWIYKNSCMTAIRLPGARIVTGQPAIWQIAVYYALVFSALFIMRRTTVIAKKEEKEYKEKDCKEKKNSRQVRGNKQNGGESARRKHSIWIKSAVVMCGMAVFLLTHRWGEAGQLMTAVLDVGQGDCIYLKGPDGGTYLVDGGSSDVGKVGQYLIEPFLKSQGVRELDYVLVSHGDSDHIGGISEMLDRQDIGVRIRTLVFPVQDVWDEALSGLAQKAENAGTQVVVIDAGQVLTESGMSITCLQPGSTGIREEDDGNAASMVLAVHYEGFDMLLTGDVEAEGEEVLTEKLEDQYPDCTWEVLKVAHHGSKNSSSEAFLELVQPAYSMVSAGQENHYGHPHQETLDRLEEVGSKMFSTQENGAILIYVEDRKMRMRSYL